MATSMDAVRHFYQLSRPGNVYITLGAFVLSAFIANDKTFDFLLKWNFYVAAGCLAMVAATGYWINDVYDFKIDRINKPGRVIVNAQLSVKKVLTAYFVVLVLILAASALFLNVALTFLTLGAALILFGYAFWLKRTTIVGNIVVAALTALVVYYAIVMYQPKIALFWAAVFAFEVNFIREIVKDMEDIEGDLRFKLQTLPIRMGTKAAKRTVALGYALFLLTCPVPFFEEYLRMGFLNWPYLVSIVIGVMLPGIALLVDLRRCEVKADFSRQSKMLKWLMLAGMLTLLFLQ